MQKLSNEQVHAITQENLRLHADPARFESTAQMTLTYGMITRRTVTAMERLGYQFIPPHAAPEAKQ